MWYKIKVCKSNERVKIKLSLNTISSKEKTTLNILKLIVDSVEIFKDNLQYDNFTLGRLIQVSITVIKELNNNA